MPLDPIIGFIISYIVLLILAVRGFKVYTVIGGMILSYIVVSSTPLQSVKALVKLGEWNDLRVFIYIFFSMLLAGMMRETGLLDKMVESLSASSCKLALTGVPSLIGLMPMPGGALVSAIALRKKYLEEAHLSPEDSTYLNYWFRHLWVPSWPLFQSVVITASVLYISPLRIVYHTWPGTIAAIVGGVLISYPILRNVSCPGLEGGLIVFLASISPLISLVILFFTGIPMLYALILVNLIFIIIWRPSKLMLIKALQLATRPTIHLVLFESLYFKNLLLGTGIGPAMKYWASQAGINPYILVFTVPFILGLAAGGENFFASTAMPALVSYFIKGGSFDWELISIAYLGGYLGVMGSPVHLCLALTLDYFHARTGPVLAKVYSTIVIGVIVGLAIIISLW